VRFATKAEFSGVLSTSRTIGFSPNSSFLNLPVPRLAIDGKIISPPSRNMGFLRFGMLHLHEALTSCPVIRFTMRAIQPTSSGMPRPALFVPWLSIRFRGVGLPGAGWKIASAESGRG
jgi:hypothetical protein